MRYLGLLIVATLAAWGSFVDAITGTFGTAADRPGAERSVQLDDDATTRATPGPADTTDVPSRATAAIGNRSTKLDTTTPATADRSTQLDTTTISATADRSVQLDTTINATADRSTQLDTTIGATVDRSVQLDGDGECDLVTVGALAARNPDVGQFIIMRTDEWSATSGTVEVAVRDSEHVWRCQTSPLPAAFGRTGTRPLAERVSGDGTTPAGVFPLGVVTAWDGEVFSLFGNSPDPGALAPYRDVRHEDCWGATAHTASYGRLVNRPGCPGPDDEWLRSYGDAYAHAAVIGANLDPVSGDEPGETPYASAIFLHRNSYRDGAAKPTSGCVSLAYDDLVTAIRLIDPELDPHFAIGPTDWLRSNG